MIKKVFLLLILLIFSCDRKITNEKLLGKWYHIDDVKYYGERKIVNRPDAKIIEFNLNGLGIIHSRYFEKIALSWVLLDDNLILSDHLYGTDTFNLFMASDSVLIFEHINTLTKNIYVRRE